MFRLILWILILFIIYRLLASVILPWAVRWYVARAKRTYAQHQGGNHRIRMEDGEGEIIIPKKGEQNKTSGTASSEIEDVPFEEI